MRLPKIPRPRGACVLIVLALSGHAAAQPYPSKPVRFIAGQTAGGATDIFARMISQKLSEAWKNPVVVENRPGAAGGIASELTARAAPDGYTLLLATAGQIVINQSLYPKSGFDPLKELAPVAFVASSPLLLVTHPAVPAKTAKELIALAKSRPDGLTHGSGGSGSPAHLAAELFKSQAGIRMTHVPFKGVAPSVTSVMGGEIDATFATLAATLTQVRSGRLRAIGVSTPKRSASAPDIPAIAESGLPGYNVSTWYGFFGPAGLPRDLVARLHTDISRVLDSPDMRDRFARDGADPIPLSVEQFGAMTREEAARWAKLIKAAGIKGD